MGRTQNDSWMRAAGDWHLHGFSSARRSDILANHKQRPCSNFDFEKGA